MVDYMKSILKVTIVGAGHCGRQIAHCMASAGIRTTCFERDVEQLSRARTSYESSRNPRLELHPPSNLKGTPPYEKIDWTTDLDNASDCDLLLESVTESLQCKRDAMRPFATKCIATTVFATNSSYYLPSSVFQGLPNPERFVSMHFHVPPWIATAVDVMPTPRTSQETMNRVEALVYSIGLTPIRLNKEYPGYIFNSLLHPLLVKSLELADRGLCRPETIDLAWREVTGMSIGPFGIMLEIGLPTLRTIVDRAAMVLADNSTVRAQRFLRSWGGELKTSTLNASWNKLRPRLQMVCNAQNVFEHASDNGSPESLTAIKLSDRSESNNAFKFVWNEYDVIAEDSILVTDPDSHRFEASWTVIGESPFAQQLSLKLGQVPKQLGVESPNQIIIWVVESEVDKSQQLDASPKEVSMTLFEQLEFFERTVLKHSQQNEMTAILAVIPLNEFGGRTRAAWGVEPMLRSARFKSLSSGNTQSHSFCFRCIEVDLSSPTATHTVAGAASAFAMSVSGSGSGSGSRTVENQNLSHELSLRYERGAWMRPVLKQQVSAPFNTNHLRESLAESNWVVSGAARGPIAAMSFELGKLGACIHFVGNTPESSEPWCERNDDQIASARRDVCRDAARKRLSLFDAVNRFDEQVALSRIRRRFQEHEIDFVYHHGDLASIGVIQRVCEEVRSRRGYVHGFLNGAGFEKTSRSRRLSTNMLQKMIETRVEVARNLVACIERNTRWVIHCSSLTGFHSSSGSLHDAAINGFLANDSVTLSTRWPDLQALTISWPEWHDTLGVSSKSEEFSVQSVDDKRMSIEEGLGHFLKLIANGNRGHVLIMYPKDLPHGLRDSVDLSPEVTR